MCPGVDSHQRRGHLGAREFVCIVDIPQSMMPRTCPFRDVEPEGLFALLTDLVRLARARARLSWIKETGLWIGDKGSARRLRSATASGSMGVCLPLDGRSPR
jgi:hypothetical protein